MLLAQPPDGLTVGRNDRTLPAYNFQMFKTLRLTTILIHYSQDERAVVIVISFALLS